MSTPKIPEVQVAFQGGGAMLIAMLPVVEAFHYCHQSKIIKIKAVAGASAGAICASLIAADCDFAELKKYLTDKGQHHVSKIVEPNGKALLNLGSNFSIDSGWMRATWDVWKAKPELKSVVLEGDPVFNEVELRIFIQGIMKCCRSKNVMIEGHETKLTIVVTNLSNAAEELHVGGSLNEALINSCSYPIALRSFKSRHPLVDGGLSDNLPVNCLIDGETAPIFAVFPTSTVPSPPATNLFSYLNALFAAAINSKVKAAKEIVKEAHQFSVEADFSTFDFNAALNKLADGEWYKRERDAAVARIQNFAASFGTLYDGHSYRLDDARTISSYASVLEGLTRDYDQYFDHVLARTTVHVRCRDGHLTTEQLATRPADIVVRTTKLRAKKGFRYYRSAVPKGPGANPTIWSVVNETQARRPLSIRVLSLDRTTSGSIDAAYCLIEILDADKHVRDGDIVEIVDRSSTSEPGTMKDLNLGKSDFIRGENPHDYNLSQFEMVLFYPRSLGTLAPELVISANSTANVETFVPVLEFEDPDNAAIGVRAKNVRPGQELKCNFVPARKP